MWTPDWIFWLLHEASNFRMLGLHTALCTSKVQVSGLTSLFRTLWLLFLFLPYWSVSSDLYSWLVYRMISW